METNNKAVLAAELRGLALGLHDIFLSLAELTPVTDDNLMTYGDAEAIRQTIKNAVFPILDQYVDLFKQHSQP